MDQPTVLIFEDRVHELILRKILTTISVDPSAVNWFPKRGKSYIDSRIRDYATIHGTRMIVLRDLDHDAACAPELLRKLLGSVRQSNDLIFRIAVTEAEAWLLADKINAIDYFKLRASVVDGINPDFMTNPKEELLHLINRGRLSSREKGQFCVRNAAGALQQATTYNESMAVYIENIWSITEARQNSKSLDRAVSAITASFRRNG